MRIGKKTVLSGKSTVLVVGLAIAMMSVAMASLWLAGPTPARAEPLLQPKTPHPVEGRSDCLLCHAPGKAKPVGDSHKGRENSTCLACHPLETKEQSSPTAGASSSSPSPQASAASGPPKTSHTLVGRSNCLLCHAPGEAVPVGDSHKGREVSTCLACHPAADAKSQVSPTVSTASVSATATPTPAAKVEAPKTSHAVEGRSDCLLCHAPGKAKPVGDSHKGRENSTCLACHPAADAKSQVSPTVSTASVSATATPTAVSKAQPSPTTTARSPTPKPAALMSDEACLNCHSSQGASMTLTNGEKMSVYVDGQVLSRSVHGGKLQCMACHTDITGYPHPQRNVSSRRDYSSSYYEACKSCHFANYTKSLDGMHYKLLASGNKQSPVCSDCHGAHDVAHPAARRASISQTCARCHEAISKDYVESVHGKALTEGNGDVPACTDCHGAHSMADPRTREFHVSSPDLCANCHTNKEVMDRYNISTNVVKTYLQDFHGLTVGLYKSGGPADSSSLKAVCTDCHGIHDIKQTDDPYSSVIRANLVTTCRKCHADATDNFPAAWLNHYEPSPTKWPIVYYVQMFYRVIIPLIVGGLTLHIGLDFWRTLLNRFQGKRS